MDFPILPGSRRPSGPGPLLEHLVEKVADGVTRFIVVFFGINTYEIFPT